MSNAERPGWVDAGYRHIWMPYTQMQAAPLPEAVMRIDVARSVLDKVFIQPGSKAALRTDDPAPRSTIGR